MSNIYLRIRRLREIWEQASGGLKDPNLHWHPQIKIEAGEDDEPDYYWLPQGAYLGMTLINLGDTYEESGEDCLLVQEAVRSLPELLDELEKLLKERDDAHGKERDGGSETL